MGVVVRFAGTVFVGRGRQRFLPGEVGAIVVVKRSRVRVLGLLRLRYFWEEMVGIAVVFWVGLGGGFNITPGEQMFESG